MKRRRWLRVGYIALAMAAVFIFVLVLLRVAFGPVDRVPSDFVGTIVDKKVEGIYHRFRTPSVRFWITAENDRGVQYRVTATKEFYQQASIGMRIRRAPVPGGLQIVDVVPHE